MLSCNSSQTLHERSALENVDGDAFVRLKIVELRRVFSKSLVFEQVLVQEFVILGLSHVKLGFCTIACS
jgi:hypothetical protein